MVEIRPCTVDEILNTPELVAEYSTYALPGMPAPNVQWDQYRLMEQAGVIHVIGAFADGKLVGFVSTIGHVSLHYGARLTLTESFFVAKQYRNSGAGIKLLRAVEQLAKSDGSTGLMITAPHNKELSNVLSAVGYHQSHEVFFKCVN